MLVLNLNRILKARGITRPYTFFIKHGFTHYKATALNAGSVKSLSHKTLEKLCIILDCTPNDLYDWSLSENLPGKKRYALQALGNKEPLPDFTGINHLLQQFSFQDLQELAEMIRGKWQQPDSGNKQEDDLKPDNGS